MDVGSKKKKGLKGVSKMFSLHKNGVAIYKTGEEQIWGYKFTLRSLRDAS